MNFHIQAGNPQTREFRKRKRRIRRLVFGILLAGVIAFFMIPPVRKAVQGKKEYRMYLEFLEGARSADGWDITEITVPTGEPEKRYFSEYAFFDCDGDGLSELHIRSGKGYYVIDCEKDKLSLWGSFLPQTALLNNGDYLYLHIGGAPLHYDYKYFKVNDAGEEVWNLMFACYDADGDGQFGEGDSYFLEDKNISYEDWLELEGKYLEVGTDDVLWTVLTETEERSWSWVIEPGKYESISFVGEDRIAVQDQSGKLALGDMWGRAITDFQYDGIARYCEGLAAVRSGESCYYIDVDGNAVFEEVFQAAGGFSEGIGAVKQNGLWGLIDKAGRVIVPAEYEEIKAFQEGKAAVKRDGKWGFLDGGGSIVVEPLYEEAESFREGRAAVKRDGKWGFLDNEGSLVVEPCYEEVKSFHEERAAVRSGGKWGYLDLQGKLCVECGYDDAGNFSEGKAAVKKAAFLEGFDAWAYIDREGRTVIDFYPYDAAGGQPFLVGEFHDGAAFVTKTLCGIIDEEGKDVFRDSSFFISEPWYNREYDMIPGYVYTDSDMTVRKYGMAGLRGEQRIEPVFDGIDSMQGKYIIVSKYRDGALKKGMIELEDEEGE
ncbi:MAG: WG repeat-containing protein [Roseburia sp.]|nr:WG repeat-containing protein [Roseburia sp.]MCM1098572.1 WG repeat-containing protein [Ruminococcus flavefaciens]